MGHHVSPRTDADTSPVVINPTLEYRPSWPGYFTMEPVVPGTSICPTKSEE
ncbi:uncharacterized, partial [Tachysurus ichikawai]